MERLTPPTPLARERNLLLVLLLSLAAAAWLILVFQQQGGLAPSGMGLTMGLVTLSEVTENQGRSDTASLHKIDSQYGRA